MPILGIMASQISGHLWAPEGAYDSLATVTVPSGGLASVVFAGIPTGYTHLQIRGIYRTDRATFPDYFKVRYNSDSGSNYSQHQIDGNGSTATSSGAANTDHAQWAGVASTVATSSVFGGGVFDLLDYANVNKYKTNRSLSGYDSNGSGRILFESGAWRNTAAVNSITIISGSGSTILQYSSFALYGVR